MQELINTVIAHYMIIRHIATGGMAEIYLARDLQTKQEVALKLVHTSNQSYCQRFQREARAVASLHHEHILPALDYGEDDSWCYLATPFVPNGTLRDLMQTGALTIEEAGKYLNQIASALQYAHQQGIIHRDIKSSNILVRDKDFVYLADFGLVKNTCNIAESLTETSFLVGTAEYMAPELAEGDATRLSDIYSLGIVLYQMVTGEVPFKGSTPLGTFMQHLSKAPLRPSQVNPNLPAAFDTIVLRSLSKEPAQRYQTALELANAYQQVLNGFLQPEGDNEKTTEHPPALYTEAPRNRAAFWRHKHPRHLAGVAVVFMVLIIFLSSTSAYLLHSANSAPHRTITNNSLQPQGTPDRRTTPLSTKRDHLTKRETTTPAPSSEQKGNTTNNNHPATPTINAPISASQSPVVSSSSDQGNGKNKDKDKGKGHQK